MSGYNIGDIVERLASWLVKQPPSVTSLDVAGSDAIAEAERLWHLDIIDPKRSDQSINGRHSRLLIDEMIRDGLGWTWEPPYTGDGAFEWCGAFASYCWRSVRADLRKTYFASTYRLDRYARYASVNGERNKGSGRLLAELDERSTSLPFEPRAGDILTIGPAGSGYGKHICLVRSYDPVKRWFLTTEGNGTGIGPLGKSRQGVVHGIRVLGGGRSDVWCARRLIRPSAEDLG